MGSETSSAFLSKQDVFRLVEKDLERVESDLKQLSVSSIPLIDNINCYLHSSGGKRLRPVLLLLCSHLGPRDENASIKLAGVVELIHAATLVHDDIIDNADMRRGRPSVNARWGSQITVLMGDWMYMTAFYLALELQNFEVLDILIDVTRTMVEGELIQLDQNGVLDGTPEDYIGICARKTARLFSASARLGGIASRSGPEVVEKLSGFGRSLGLAFQLTDDLLDYTSEEAVLGKPVLKDLEEGRITLPIILLLQSVDAGTREFITEVVQSRSYTLENKHRIIELVKEHGTLDELRRLAHQYATEAKAELQGIPDSKYLDALRYIPDLIITRTS